MSPFMKHSFGLGVICFDFWEFLPSTYEELKPLTWSKIVCEGLDPGRLQHANRFQVALRAD